MIKKAVIQGEDSRDFLVYRSGSGDTIEIYDIQVGSYRREGIGRRLVHSLVEQVPKHINLVYAITRAENIIAKQFYEGIGFRIVGVLVDFYGVKTEDGKDCVDAIMYGFNIPKDTGE